MTHSLVNSIKQLKAPRITKIKSQLKTASFCRRFFDLCPILDIKFLEFTSGIN